MRKVQHFTLEIFSYVGMFFTSEIDMLTHNVYFIGPKIDAKNSPKFQFCSNSKVKFKSELITSLFKLHFNKIKTF